MSIVNFKIIFAKKQKQTRQRPTQGRGATFICNRNGRFHTTDGLFVWDGLSVAWLTVNFDGRQFEDRLSVSDSLCTTTPSPQKKSAKGCVWGRGRLHKIPVSSSEGLYRTAVFRCLVHRPHYSARLMRFGSRGPSEFFFSDTPPKCPDRDCMGRRRTGNRHGNVYHIVREKQGMCFTNSDISACCFTSISRARPPENHKY